VLGDGAAQGHDAVRVAKGLWAYAVDAAWDRDRGGFYEQANIGQVRTGDTQGGPKRRGPLIMVDGSAV
jgi:hypothetical protein